MTLISSDFKNSAVILLKLIQGSLALGRKDEAIVVIQNALREAAKGVRR